MGPVLSAERSVTDNKTSDFCDESLGCEIVSNSLWEISVANGGNGCGQEPVD